MVLDNHREHAVQECSHQTCSVTWFYTLKTRFFLLYSSSFWIQNIRQPRWRGSHPHPGTAGVLGAWSWAGLGKMGLLSFSEKPQKPMIASPCLVKDHMLHIA